MDPSYTPVSKPTNGVVYMPDDLFKFYLLRCPYAKSDKSAASAANALNLSDNGWSGAKLHQLMQWIALNFVGDNEQLNLRFLASDNISGALERQGFGIDGSLPESPAACILINHRLSIDEEGQCKLKLTETYATCLFRHIRNSLAHGNYQELNSGRIVLRDCSSKSNTSSKDKKYTFGMVTTMQFLRELKNLIENEAPAKVHNATKGEMTVINGYRIKIDKKLQVEIKEDDA